MPRLITITLGCDWNGCTVEGTEDNDTVVPKTLSIDGNKPKQFLVCKNHLDDFDAIVMPLMQAGVKIETPKRSTRSSGGGTSTEPSRSLTEPQPVYTCEHPGCGRTMSGRTGMAQHVKRTHDYENLAAYEAVYPLKPDNHE